MVECLAKGPVASFVLSEYITMNWDKVGGKQYIKHRKLGNEQEEKVKGFFMRERRKIFLVILVAYSQLKE